MSRRCCFLLLHFTLGILIRISCQSHDYKILTMRRPRLLYLAGLVVFLLGCGLNAGNLMFILHRPQLYLTLMSSCFIMMATPSCLLEVLLSHGLRPKLSGMLRSCLNLLSISLEPAEVGWRLSAPLPHLLLRTRSAPTGLDTHTRSDPPELLGMPMTGFRLIPVLIGVLFNSGFASVSSTSSLDYCHKDKPNPDIVGSGVRCIIYILLLFVFLSLFVASFHTKQSGTKELGCTTLISKPLPWLKCTIRELILHRSLRDELELRDGYGQAEQLHPNRLSGRCAYDRRTVCCVVCHSLVKRCASISMVCWFHAPRPKFCLGSSCACQP